jgi:hypothetical protein
MRRMSPCDALWGQRDPRRVPVRRQRRLATRILLMVALLVPPGEARSQTSAGLVGSIAVGSKVRLLAPTAMQGRIEGTVMATDAESLLIGVDGRGPARVSRNAITRLEIAFGRRRNTRTGLIVGAVAGALAVGLTAAIPKDEFCPPGEPSTQSCLDDRSVLLAFGLPILALEGAAIGALIKSDRWLPVPLENVRVGLTGTRSHGVGLSLALHF